MPQEAFCPEHGPYDASLGACPYPHAGAYPRPNMPISLDDDLSTVPPCREVDDGAKFPLCIAGDIILLTSTNLPNFPLRVAGNAIF